MPTRKPIENGWRSYAEHVLPTEAEDIQTQETRRAFYAGARLVLSVMFNDIGTDSTSEDDGIKLLESMHVETDEFLEDVKRGRK